MNGVTFKAVLITSALLTSATSIASKDIYHTKAGCMSCHQDRTPKTETEVKKKNTKKKAYAESASPN